MRPNDPSEIEIGGPRLPQVAWDVISASVQALVAALLATMA
jgi:hypothetical protein